ncbi:MAG TPA: transporter [Chroococcales cyanobacterium]|jgi:hypothetical protein
MKKSIGLVFLAYSLFFLPAAIASPLEVTPADTFAPLKGWISLTPGYSFALGLFTSSGETKSLSSGESYTRISLPIELRFGLIDRLEGNMLLPIQNSRFASGMATSNGTGLGDLSLALKYRLSDEPILSAFCAGKFPTGKSSAASEAAITGTGSTDLSIGLLMSREAGNIRFTGNLGYTMCLEGTRTIGVNPPDKRDYPDFLKYGLSGEYPFLDGFEASLEAVGIIGLTPLSHNGFAAAGSEPLQFALTPGLTWNPLANLEISAGYRYPLLGKANDVDLEPAYQGPILGARTLF